MSEPTDAPPSYDQVTGSSTASKANNNRTTSSSLLGVPQEHNGIPMAARRSMEDEQRPLPPGWVRQFDAKEEHQFFVDTNADPPRSIWHHPYDDEDYLKTLSSEERERIQEQEREMRKSVHYDTTDDEATTSPRDSKGDVKASSSSLGGGAQAGQSSSTQTKAPSKAEKPSFGRKWKDKLTGSTHEEREQQRAKRAEEERQYYEAHMRFRQAMQKAQVTGQPQFFAKDKDGKDIYVEPPTGYGYGAGGYNRGGYGYNPYSAGPYSDPNVRYIRPQGPYGRPYGGGYGGYGGYGGGGYGYGAPLAGGLLGGLLLGGLLF